MKKSQTRRIQYYEKSCSPIVSIVIVNYNAGPLLSKVVVAALQSTIPVEIFVCDNGSSDGSLALLYPLHADSRLRIIENNANLGFARANNIALKQAVGEFTLLLNPDCIIQANTLERLLAAIKSYPETRMVGCLVRNPDGTEQAGCRRRVPSPWRTIVRVLHLNRLFPNDPRFRRITLSREPLPVKPVFLEAISGSFMLIRRHTLAQIGFLDENYFLHCEDLDLCMQFQRKSWPILFVPEVEVVHYQGTCSASRPIRVMFHKHKGMIFFYRKFFRHQYPAALMGLVIVAVWSRFALLATSLFIKARINALRPGTRSLKPSRPGVTPGLEHIKKPKILSENTLPIAELTVRKRQG